MTKTIMAYLNKSYEFPIKLIEIELLQPSDNYKMNGNVFRRIQNLCKFTLIPSIFDYKFNKSAWMMITQTPNRTLC